MSLYALHRNPPRARPFVGLSGQPFVATVRENNRVDFGKFASIIFNAISTERVPRKKNKVERNNVYLTRLQYIKPTTEDPFDESAVYLDESLLETRTLNTLNVSSFEL